jgi:hypothetical protein
VKEKIVSFFKEEKTKAEKGQKPRRRGSKKKKEGEVSK